MWVLLECLWVLPFYMRPLSLCAFASNPPLNHKSAKDLGPGGHTIYVKLRYFHIQPSLNFIEIGSDRINEIKWTTYIIYKEDINKFLFSKVRVYDRLFKHKNPEDSNEVPGGFLSDIKTNTLKFMNAKADTYLSSVKVGWLGFCTYMYILLPEKFFGHIKEGRKGG